MNYVGFLVYFGVSIIAIILTVMVVVSCFRKNTAMARCVAITGIGCLMATVSYFVRVLCTTKLCFSVATAFHLVGIDIGLSFFLIFTLYFTKYAPNPWKLWFVRLIMLCCFADLVIYLVNIFYPISIVFDLRNTPIAVVYYQHMTPLYWAHLGFSYLLILATFIILIRQVRLVPKQYGRQYTGMALGLLVILVMNFIGGGFHRGLVDYGVGGYCLLVLYMYWYVYQYPTHGMLNFLKMSVFDNVEQAIVLFDYSGRLVLGNERAKRMFSNVQFTETLDQQKFVAACNISIDLESCVDVFSFQCNVKPKSVSVPLRCEFRRLRNKSDSVLGNLFVFTDAILETDNLTSFQDWESFRLFAINNKDSFSFPMMVVVCDINKLSVVNSTHGHSVGDRLLRDFASSMKEYFPQSTYFVRGPEAELIALTYGMDGERIAECMEKIGAGIDARFLYAMEEASSWMPNVMVAVESACQALRQKKLLDRDSVHSEMLGSLIKALEECDSDTEAHVLRTQKMGEALGKKIGLSDRQLSDLSLLCLLHDIGKIGVPLEILNKPTKLTDEEWKTIQSHVEKGFEIAKSSKDLFGIADMIRHHHERWDGRGYPDGLSRENIPLLSRVICVVDSFDAMVSDRAYRKGMSVDAAMTELMRCSGSQFDPFLVTEFLPICQKIASEKGEASVPRSPTTRMQILPSEPSKQTFAKHVHELFYSRYTLDPDMKIIQVDDNFEKITGYTRDDVQKLMLCHHDLIPKDDLAEYVKMTTEALSSRQMAYCEHRLLCKDGSLIYVFCFGRVYFDSVTKELRSEIIISNSADSYAMKVLSDKGRGNVVRSDIVDPFRRDVLTGMLTPIAFRGDVQDLILSNDYKIMFLMFDVDLFRRYKEDHGSVAADELIAFVGQTIRESLRGSDLSCHLDEDVYAAALMFKKDCSSEFMCSRAQQIFDKILMILSSSASKTSMSMGVAIAENEIRSFGQLQEAAEKALADAKLEGRSRMSVYEQD